MFTRANILILLLTLPLITEAQVSSKSFQDLRKSKWEKVYASGRKALRKDSANAAAYFLFANYFCQLDNPSYHLDSAYVYVLKSLQTYDLGNKKAQDKWRRMNVDRAQLTGLKEQIDSAAFEGARRKNTEEAYNTFLKFYATAEDRPAAEKFRDSVAFSKAEYEHTHRAFADFMKRYPNSSLLGQAKQRYEQLLYEESTKGGSIEDYESFLNKHPESPYVTQAHRNLFEIITANGTPESFTKYAERYPDSQYAKRSKDILYHLLVEEHTVSLYPSAFLSDSLQSIRENSSRFLVPFMVKGKFGFMNAQGREELLPSFEDVSDEYICGNITDDILLVDRKLMARDGSFLRDGVDSVEDLGYGFLKAQTGDSISVVHKSGFTLMDDPLVDAKVLEGRVVAVRKENYWGLFTLGGRQLLPFQYEEVNPYGNILSFKIGGRYALLSIDSLVSTLGDVRSGELYDEVRKFDGNSVWVKANGREGIVNPTLEHIVPLHHHRVQPTFFGALVYDTAGVKIVNYYGEQSSAFSEVNHRNPWVAVRVDSLWMLYDASQNMAKSVLYDSLAILGPFAAGIRREGIEVHFSKDSVESLLLLFAKRVETLPFRDSLTYLLVGKDGPKGEIIEVYDQVGRKLFTTSYYPIQAIAPGHFLVSNKDKKGILDLKGKLVVPLEYDAIGKENNGIVSLLKASKFGAYEFATKRLIKPAYDKNIAQYAKGIFLVSQGGLQGFFSNSGKPLSNIEFNEIMPWTDSVALARKDNMWMLYNIYDKRVEAENITEFKVVKNSPEERIYIVKQNGALGVLSSRRGVVVPVKFTDIVNVGSPDEPVYFTEKHVQEASLFVVIYYDAKGLLIRKEVYDQDDYERIYCSK